ncbi:hypothetical protein [Geofilum rhodophaeum]|uniref:hypothetical protein n=1 Tax=Geofilum rhodophaeum TaxID=1965019 RepID=UPI000B52902C|nr:hypothetical protein [Geofilum rhodophaeum]
MMFKDGNKVGKFYGLLLMGFIIMVIIGIVLHNSKMSNHIDIRNLNSLNGVVVKVKADRSSAFGELQDGRRVFFFDSDNYNYKPYSLCKFLNIGDSIIKHNQSDTLYIYRDEKEYYFVLGKSIGE